jgi:hypothetical protein
MGRKTIEEKNSGTVLIESWVFSLRAGGSSWSMKFLCGGINMDVPFCHQKNLNFLSLIFVFHYWSSGFVSKFSKIFVLILVDRVVFFKINSSRSFRTFATIPSLLDIISYRP